MTTTTKAEIRQNIHRHAKMVIDMYREDVNAFDKVVVEQGVATAVTWKGLRAIESSIKLEYLRVVVLILEDENDAELIRVLHDQQQRFSDGLRRHPIWYPNSSDPASNLVSLCRGRAFLELLPTVERWIHELEEASD